MPSLDALLAGPPIKKILFMTSPEVVDKVLKPYWEPRAETPGFGASVLQVYNIMYSPCLYPHPTAAGIPAGTDIRY